MSLTQRIAFLGGGVMAGAIHRSLLAAGLMAAEMLTMAEAKKLHPMLEEQYFVGAMLDADPEVALIVPAGAGNQIRIGDRREPEPGTIRRLVADHRPLLEHSNPVLAPPGDHVQRETDFPQEGLRGAQLAQLAQQII